MRNSVQVTRHLNRWARAHHGLLKTFTRHGRITCRVLFVAWLFFFLFFCHRTSSKLFSRFPADVLAVFLRTQLLKEIEKKKRKRKRGRRQCALIVLYLVYIFRRGHFHESTKALDCLPVRVVILLFSFLFFPQQSSVAAQSSLREMWFSPVNYSSSLVASYMCGKI